MEFSLVFTRMECSPNSETQRGGWTWGFISHSNKGRSSGLQGTMECGKVGRTSMRELMKDKAYFKKVCLCRLGLLSVLHLQWWGWLFPSWCGGKNTSTKKNWCPTLIRQRQDKEFFLYPLIFNYLPVQIILRLKRLIWGWYMLIPSGTTAIIQCSVLPATLLSDQMLTQCKGQNNNVLVLVWK